MANLAKPGQLRVALILMGVELVYGIIHFIMYEASIYASSFKTNIFVSYIFILLSALFIAFFLYKIYKGRAWARLACTILSIFSFFVSLSSTFDYAKYPVALAFIGSIVAVVDIVSLVLLWHPATTRWFKAMKIARLAAPETTNIEESSSNVNADSNLQIEANSTINASESTRSVISYNKFLKILRVVRVLYVLSLILIFINITAIYGLIVYDIAKYPMFPNTAKLIGWDRSITLFIPIIWFISIIYIIVENLIDKKLEYFPKELIDRSYSNKATLFLSFLYVYFFFSLNNRILVSFFYMTPYLNINNKPGIGPLIYLAISDIAIICFVFKYLIRKIDNKKLWKYFWIFAPFIFLIIGTTEMLIVKLGMLIFADPFLFIINTLKSFSGATG